MTVQGRVLIWRSKLTDTTPKPFPGPRTPYCQWCGTQWFIHPEKWNDLGGGYDARITTWECPLCGWHAQEASQIYAHITDFTEYSMSTLRTFDVNAPELGLEELGTHLRTHFSDIHQLSWRRFEEVIADVFRAHGARLILTQATRDGGADILLYETNSGALRGIVECKKYRGKIGVSLVRNLVGCAVDWEVKQATLVTTGQYSKCATEKASSFRNRGYTIDLVGASELLELLKVYNVKMPSLVNLTSSVRKEIIRVNLQEMSIPNEIRKFRGKDT